MILCPNRQLAAEPVEFCLFKMCDRIPLSQQKQALKEAKFWRTVQKGLILKGVIPILRLAETSSKV